MAVQLHAKSHISLSYYNLTTMFAKVTDKFHKKQQSSTTSKPPPAPTSPVKSQATPPATRMEVCVNHVFSANLESDRTLSGAGSSASSSLSAVPPQDRTLSSALNPPRTMSVEMTDASDEERMREKAREAQEQAAAAAANLHHATQQARVAAINAAATQAALDSSSGKTPIPAQPLRKTAGRYALADFAIERT